MMVELIGSSGETKAKIKWSKLLGNTTKINLEKVLFKNSILISLFETFYTDSNDQAYKVGSLVFFDKRRFYQCKINLSIIMARNTPLKKISQSKP